MSKSEISIDNEMSVDVRASRKTASIFPGMHIVEATDYLCWLANEPEQKSENDNRVTLATLIQCAQDEKNSVEPVVGELISFFESEVTNEFWDRKATRQKLLTQVEDGCPDFVWSCMGLNNQVEELDEHLAQIEPFHAELKDMVGEKYSVNIAVGRHPYSSYCGVVNADLGSWVIDERLTGVYQ